MAINISDNLQYKGAKPDFTRQQYATKADMVSVNDNQMPPLYIAYCLEDKKVYLYNKENEPDETTGRFREFTAGSSTQVSEMPDASAATLSLVVQYIGETDGEYTKGYFYIGDSDESTEEVPVETLEQLSDLIGRSDGVINLVTGEATESVQALLKESDAYFVKDNVVYHGTVSDDVVLFANCVVIENDEAVVDLNLTEEVPVETLTRLNALIEESTDTITLRIDSETTETATAIIDNDNAYFIKDDVTYKGSIVSDEVAFDDCVAITTDEEVVALNLVETVAVTTLERLTELIEASDGIITLKENVSESVQALLKESDAYFVYSDVIYHGTMSGSTVVLADSTAVTTDEEVVALNLTETVTSYTYKWSNLAVSPSGGEPQTIPISEIDSLFE